MSAVQFFALNARDFGSASSPGPALCARVHPDVVHSQLAVLGVEDGDDLDLAAVAAHRRDAHPLVVPLGLGGDGAVVVHRRHRVDELERVRELWPADEHLDLAVCLAREWN